MPESTPPRVQSDATVEFGRRVRDLRQGLGLTQEGLAEGTSLHWSYVGQVERGRVNLTLHNILKFAEILGVDPSELVRGLTHPDKV